jgi:adenosylmethionine-8-amino-7-oxononanoate aminotransferase
LTTGGAESIEAAYHLALSYWVIKGKKKKTKLISFKNCYRGSTFLCASANPRIPSYGFSRITGSYVPHFIHLDFPNGNYFPRDQIRNDENLEQAAARVFEETVFKHSGTEEICAFLFEPIQGDGGCVIPHDDYFPLISKICDKYDILMIADEVVTGFGRTGKWFAMEHWKVQPDIITFSKGVSSGYLPLGGVIMTDDVKRTALDSRPEGEEWIHDYTFAGSCCPAIAALMNQEIMERENLVEACAEKGVKFLSLLTDALSGLPIVMDVRGA